MKNLNIEIIKDEQISNEEMSFYFVKLDGETIYECMNEQEIKELTIADILKAFDY